MKKYFLFLTVLLSIIVAHGQTNIYHPFPDTNAIWAYRGWNIYNLPGHNGEWRYGMKGDTIINGKNYKKIYSLKDSTITDLPNAPSTYYAAIREQNKKIYTVIDTLREELLYDFNLSVGDTITYHYCLMKYPPADTFSRVVTKIDSILLLDGKYRKRWSLGDGINCYHPDIVVEGIGSINWWGLFNPLVNAIITNGDEYELTCFKQNDTALYIGNTLCNHCFCALFTAINNVEEENKFSIFPNPFSSQTTLQTDKFLKNASLIVYNSFGQTVKQIDNLTGQTIIFRKGNLPSGLYFVRITQDNKTISADKLVIIDN